MMTSDTSTRITHGTASSSMVTGSGLGEAIPANTNTPKIMNRRHFLIRSWLRIPAMLSITSASGSSKASPKPSSRRSSVA